MFQLKKHADFVVPWKQAMATGLMDGRPFSENTQKHYSRYVSMFLEKHAKVSFENLRSELGSIPVHQYAKKDEIYRAIVSFAKYLIRENALSLSFLEKAKQIRPKRHQDPKRLSVNQEEINKLLVTCKKPLDRLIIILLVSTGLRASEACSLRIRDLDFEDRVIIVRKGKWGKGRRVGMPDGLAHEIEACLFHREGLRMDDYLLVNSKGQEINRIGLYKRLKKLGRMADVQVSPHALRRAFVTINVANNIPLVYLQIACGHSDIKTTRSYTQTTEDEVIEAMKTRFTSFSSPQPHVPPLSGHTVTSSEGLNAPLPSEPL